MGSKKICSLSTCVKFTLRIFWQYIYIVTEKCFHYVMYIMCHSEFSLNVIGWLGSFSFSFNPMLNFFALNFSNVFNQKARHKIHPTQFRKKYNNFAPILWVHGLDSIIILFRPLHTAFNLKQSITLIHLSSNDFKLYFLVNFRKS